MFELIKAVLSCDIIYQSSLFQRWRSILFLTFIDVGIVCMVLSVLGCVASRGVMGLEPAIENKYRK